jgi:mercuric ion binding protein
MKLRRLAIVLSLCLPLTAQATTIQMTVNGLVCAFCAQGIEKKLRKFPATSDVFVDLEHRLVAVGLKDGQDISDQALRKALTDAGYTVKTIERTDTPIAEVRSRLEATHK